MARAITQPQLMADQLVLTAVKQLVQSYQQTKTVGDYGAMDFAKAEKLIVQAALRKNRRGNSGFRSDIPTVIP
jgi:hypothetical protein